MSDGSGHRGGDGPEAERTADSAGRLEQVLAEYLLAVEAGSAPDRSALLGRHPELASDLRAFFADDDRANRLAAGGAAADIPTTGTPNVSISGPAVPPAAPDVPGYEILGPLGQGGMGVVWRAVQLSTHRQVALKLMKAAHFGSGKGRLRFDREVELTAKLQHPNVARVYDSGLRQGVYYYAMELVEGGVPLDQYVRDHALPRREILGLVKAVCEAVQHAHQRGVIHRDLKPGNILVDKEGGPKVLDFGLAKALEETAGAADVSVSVDGEVAGTPAYMSPEQAAGRADKPDTRTDVYSLGVILYRLLIGKSPHDLSGSRMEVLRRISSDEVVRPRRADPKLDRELEALLLKALAREPDRRYAAAGEFANDIGNYLAGEPLTAKAPTTGYFLRKRVAKYKGRLAVAAGLVVLLVVGTLYSAVNIVRARNAALGSAAEAKRHERAAKAGLADSWNSQGDAMSLVGRWGEARGLYQQSSAMLGELGLPTLPAEWGLWSTFATSPPPLGTFGPATTPPSSLPPSRPASRPATGPAGGLQGLAAYWAGAAPQTEPFAGHKGKVTSAAVSPDGRVALSGDVDGIVNAWDLLTLRGLRSWPAHEGGVTAVAFLPDGRRFASAGHDGTLKTWEPDGVVRTYEGHTGGVRALAVSADGEFLLSGSDDKTVKLWRVDADQPDVTFTGHEKGVTAVAFWPGGRYVVSAASDHTLIRWDIRGGSRADTLSLHNHPYAPAVVSPDGRYVYRAIDNARVTRMDPQTHADASDFGRFSYPDAMALSADGKKLFIGYDDSTVRVWDTGSQQLLRLLIGHADRVTAVAPSADGRLLVSGSSDGTLKLWDVRGLREARSLVGATSGTERVEFSPDGRLLLTVWFNGTCGVWDLATDLLLGTRPVGPNAVCGFAADGLTPRVFDPPQGSQRRGIFCRDGRRAISVCPDHTLRSWDTASGAPGPTYVGHEDEVWSVAISPDGRRLLSGSGDGVIKLWDVDSGRALRSLTGHTHPVQGLAFSPDGSRALSAGDDATVRLWDLGTGRESLILRGHTGIVNCAVFSPDGRFALSAGYSDTTVRLWDLATGREMRTFREHADGVTWVAFSPDGRTVASASTSPGVVLRDVSRPGRCHDLEPGAAKAYAALRSDPKDAAALASLGRWYAFRGIDDWAVELLERPRAGGAEVPPADLARSYWRTGAGARARAEFRTAVEKGPADPYLQLCLGALERKPYGGTPAAVPGLIYATEFDEGPEGETYHDIRLESESKTLVRAALESPFKPSSARTAVRVSPGEWLDYTVQVAADGKYDVETGAFAGGRGGTLHVEFDGVDKTGSVQVPDSGRADSLPTATAHGVSLTAGRHVMRVCFDSAGTTAQGGRVGGVMNFFWVALHPPGTAPPRTAEMAFAGARWVWNAEARPDGKSPPGRRYLRRTFEVNPLRTIQRADLFLSVDDGFTLYVNEQEVAHSVGEKNDWKSPKWVDLTTRLHPGTNVLAVEAVNEPGPGSVADNPAGVLARLVVETNSGPPLVVVSDARWKATDHAPPGWEAADFNDSSWRAAEEVAPFGKGMWAKYLGQPAAPGPARPPANGPESDDPYDFAGAFTDGGALLLADDTEGYKRLCARLLEMSGNGKRLGPGRGRYLLARLCLLAPDGVADPAVPLWMADQGVRAQPTWCWYLHMLGLAHYRAGADDEALKWLQQSVREGSTWAGQPVNWLAMAMAHHCLGHTDEAEQWLGKATEAIDTDRREKPGAATPLGMHAHDWLEFRLLRREAEAMILGRLPSTGPATQPAGPSPFRERLAAVPGVVQAEDFDDGGDGEAYHKRRADKPGNGRGYRESAGVVLDDCGDEGGGYNVGGIFPGEWLAYTVDVAEAGAYDVELRVSSPHGGGTMHLELAGANITGPLIAPSTGDWQVWKTVSKRAVRLPAGRQTLRVVFDAAGEASTAGDGWHVCNFNWARFTKSRKPGGDAK